MKREEGGETLPVANGEALQTVGAGAGSGWDKNDVRREKRRISSTERKLRKSPRSPGALQRSAEKGPTS